MPALDIQPILLDHPRHATDLVDLLEHYARDPMGGGCALDEQVRTELPQRLREWPGYHGFLAYRDERAVGLINCFLGFSTFKARPLLNIHDIVVRDEARGQGVAQALLAAAERAARAHGCCKLTLEMLSNNAAAQRSYARFGFAPYVLDPAAGQALFLQKWLAAD